MRSRIEDVAAAAGVSMKTVSRVLNNEPNVRDEMRQRVMAVVEKLQYRPNLSARSLAGQRSYVIALVYNNPSRNYLMEIQNGMLEACRDNHYNLVLAPGNVFSLSQSFLSRGGGASVPPGPRSERGLMLSTISCGSFSSRRVR